MNGRTPTPRLADRALTDREREIAALVGVGLTNQQIGDTLGLKHGTVKTHIYRIFRKTGARSRANLTTVLAGQAQRRLEQAKVLTGPEVVAVLTQLRRDRAIPNHALGTPEWYRQEGELRVLDRLSAQILAVDTDRELIEQLQTGGAR